MDFKAAVVVSHGGRVREFSYPLPSRGPLLSKQATPEVSADTHTPEPPERVAEVCATEGLRTKGRHSETVSPFTALAPPPCGHTWSRQ